MIAAIALVAGGGAVWTGSVLLNMALIAVMRWVSYHIVNDEDVGDTVLKHAAKRALCAGQVHQNGRARPHGLCIARDFVCWAGEDVVHVLCAPETFGALCTPYGQHPQHDDEDTITVYDRDGSYAGLYYIERALRVRSLEPLPAQAPIVKAMVDAFHAHGRHVALVCGPPGCGKTMLGVLVAKELGASLCKSFCPTDPGDTLACLYRRAEPSADKPLVLVFDEADVLLRAVHAQTIQRHPNVPIAVHNKATWNRFMDDTKLWDNIVVLLTSNTPKEELDVLDASYLRAGRIDAWHQVR